LYHHIQEPYRCATQEITVVGEITTTVKHEARSNAERGTGVEYRILAKHRPQLGGYWRQRRLPAYGPPLPPKPMTATYAAWRDPLLAVDKTAGRTLTRHSHSANHQYMDRA